nr:mucin-2-like [Penaeus vannamei]
MSTTTTQCREPQPNVTNPISTQPMSTTTTNIYHVTTTTQCLQPQPNVYNHNPISTTTAPCLQHNNVYNHNPMSTTTTQCLQPQPNARYDPSKPPTTFETPTPRHSQEQHYNLSKVCQGPHQVS